MDTNSENSLESFTQLKRHRHLVAFPAFAFLLTVTVISVHGAAAVTKADVTGLPPGEPRAVVQLPGGIEGVAAADASVDTSGTLPELKHGSLLVSYPGLFGVTLGDRTCFGFHGGFVVTQGEKESTVAAITTPVLVEQGEMRMIVPVGMQWTEASALVPLSSGPQAWSGSRSLADLPPEFVRTEREDLSRLVLPDTLLPPPVSGFPDAAPPLSDALLPAAREHAFTVWQDSVVSSLRAAVRDGKIDQVKALLSDGQFSAAFAGEKGTKLLALVLGETPPTAVDAQMALTEPLIRDERLWMLLAYHPDFLAVAWTFDRIDLPRESLITRLFLLPFADATADAVPDIAFTRFETGFHEVLGSMEEPEPMLKFLFTSYAPLIDRLDALGYPLRSTTLGKTLVNLLSSYAAAYPEVKTAVDGITARITRSTIALPSDLSADLERRAEAAASSSSIASAASSSSVASVEQMSPAEVERRANVLLHSAEAVFTLKTEVKADSPDVAKVTGIVFGSSSGDHTVDFLLNVTTEVVRNISIDGNSDFPFTPHFDAFVRWLKR